MLQSTERKTSGFLNNGIHNAIHRMIYTQYKSLLFIFLLN
ncbi:hypothetical protein SOVF_174590 [Spinacia oleracea]|nr:hypothetical protein SOVF_174590 [Spinacia oleracea]